jgi:hypothetical protein
MPKVTVALSRTSIDMLNVAVIDIGSRKVLGAVVNRP